MSVWLYVCVFYVLVRVCCLALVVLVAMRDRREGVSVRVHCF